MTKVVTAMINKPTIIINELFYVLTGALFIFVFLEIISPGIVLAYVNLNLVLLFWLVVGIIAVAKG